MVADMPVMATRVVLSTTIILIPTYSNNRSTKWKYIYDVNKQ